MEAATVERTAIGAEVPPELLIGAAYGPNVIRARWKGTAFAGVAAAPYAVPVCETISIETEVRK